MMDVYIVDDCAEIAQMIRIVLEIEGYEAAWARHGDEALAWLHTQECAPALLLVDLTMPGMDGATFIRQAMALPQLRDTHIAVMTADAAPAAKLRGLPISAILHKPFDLDDLLDIVENVIAPMRLATAA
ncbi:MAG: response regulator [Ktedonobacterales bacterium]|nr:response regulator [Ktedonobacterales bacterium]